MYNLLMVTKCRLIPTLPDINTIGDMVSSRNPLDSRGIDSMNHSVQRSQSLPLVAGVYFGTCFVTAEVLYGLSVLFSPPVFVLTAQTWIASFFFVGTVTTVCCAGGFLGIWFITAFMDRSIRDHTKTATLLGLVASSIFVIDFTAGRDRLIMGAVFVTALSAVVALIVKIYSCEPHSTKTVD